MRGGRTATQPMPSVQIRQVSQNEYEPQRLVSCVCPHFGVQRFVFDVSSGSVRYHFTTEL